MQNSTFFSLKVLFRFHKFPTVELSDWRIWYSLALVRVSPYNCFPTFWPRFGDKESAWRANSFLREKYLSIPFAFEERGRYKYNICNSESKVGRWCLEQVKWFSTPYSPVIVLKNEIIGAEKIFQYINGQVTLNSSNVYSAPEFFAAYLLTFSYLEIGRQFLNNDNERWNKADRNAKKT